MLMKGNLIIMMMSPAFNDALNRINALLSTDYTDEQLARLKDDIRGMALYNEISDTECYTLLEKLPSLSDGIDLTDDEIEKYKQNEEKEKEQNTPHGFDSDNSILYKLYHTAADDETEEKDNSNSGFSSSQEINDLYKNFTSDEDDEIEEKNVEDHSSFFTTNSDDYNYDDNDENIDNYEDEENEKESGQNNSFFMSNDSLDGFLAEDDDFED